MTREQICASTSVKLRSAASSLAGKRATIGVDGFVDEIIAVVDKRRSLADYTPVRTIDQLGRKIQAAAGQSSNYELVVKQMKLGGNGPIMANALASAGMKVHYIGALGFPTLHPVFQGLAERATVTSISDPGHTDALEFDDGKLMLGKHGTLRDINWDNLVERIGGLDKLIASFAASSLVGMVNWTMLPFLSDIWQKLSEQVLPRLPQFKAGKRFFFVDLCDPEKRSAESLREAMGMLSKMQGQIDVILGLNLKESKQVAEVIGLPAPTDAEAAIEDTARAIRQKLGIECVMVHPRRGAAAATSDGASGKFAGPFVKEPKISTGAGDHFNAGFCLGRVLGMNIEESLCTGVGTSGYYVRTAESPSAAQLAEFIAQLPAPEQ